MLVVIAFCLGVVNFACHQAALDRKLPSFAALPPPILWLLRTLEFALLAGALWGAMTGLAFWVWLYLAYTALNGAAAWWLFSGTAR